MDTAAEFLRDYFNGKKISQSAFALRCDVDQSLLSRLVAGDTPITRRNLPALLKGFRDREMKVRFLTAHLQDQIPSDYLQDVEVRPKKYPETKREIDVDPRRVFANGAADVMSVLPPQTPSDAYRFVCALRSNPELRDAFHGLMPVLVPVSRVARQGKPASAAPSKPGVTRGR